RGADRLRLPAAAAPHRGPHGPGPPRQVAHRAGPRHRHRHAVRPPRRDAARAGDARTAGRRRPGGVPAGPGRRRGRAPPSHPGPVGPDAHRAGAGRRLRTACARRPAAGRHRRRPGRHPHPRTGGRRRVRADGYGRGRDARTGAAGRARDDPDRDGGPVSAGTSASAGGLARPLLSLLAAAASVLAIVGLARTAVGTASGQRVDHRASAGWRGHRGRRRQYAELAVGTVSRPVIGALLGLAVLLVLLRRRPGLLLPLGVLVLGANLTTQVIKQVLVTRDVLGPGIDVTPNSFPSGHTTLAACAMIALVLAGGRARVVLAPLGTAWTTAVGIGTLVVGWHRPSDVIGAIAVVAAWTFLILALDGLDT